MAAVGSSHSNGEEASDADNRIGFRSGTGGLLGGYQHIGANPGQLRAAAARDRLLVARVEQTSSGEWVRVASSTGEALAEEPSSAWPPGGARTTAATSASTSAAAARRPSACGRSVPPGSTFKTLVSRRSWRR